MALVKTQNTGSVLKKIEVHNVSLNVAIIGKQVSMV